LLDENSSSEQVTKALQALLSCHGQKKKLRSGIEAILKKAYNSNCKERLLMQLLEIMSKDLRGYSEPLFGPIVKFAKNIQAIDAVWLLEKALQAPLPDADLGMGARELYIEALKKFALEDSERAVAVIAGYRGGNIDSHVIPRALVAIYKGVTTKEIKNVVARNVAERFVYSVAREKKDSVFYLYELEAVKALKQEVIVQEAFLEGVIAIGDVDMGRPNRMSEVVKNISMILPVEKKSQILGALKQLVEKLAIARQERAAKHICTSNVDRDNFIIAIDTICTEASLAMLAI